MKNIINFTKKYKNYIFLFIIFLLALKVFVPQIDALKESILALQFADPKWVILAIIVFFLGVLVLSLQYIILAIKKLTFKLTLQVETAELFVSRILPSGVGTIALNMYYLTQKNHTVTQASAVIAANGLSNAVAYTILVFLGLITSGFTFGVSSAQNYNINIHKIMLIALAVLIVAFLIYQIPKVKNKIKSFISGLLKNIETYKDKPKNIIMAVILNGLGSLTGIFAIYASAQALGVELTMAQALLTYTAGNIMASLVPTPGGLGSAEAGIFAGLTIAGLSTADAVSVTMLYRLISYWIPLIPGYLAFWHLRKSVLSNFSLTHKTKS
ncbi:MAG: glycosyltransferase 2 family protein [Patescibacteria group bacterium]|nr:glycosyltransferase 2 family protein [Patescibacteria group bacterium]MDQ5954054.1 glycosyltransferase 2 family protein [Patescibacteria group bacterium]MDQ5958293.1 glycosyltransferase 2 family protein [Patescibacteria group bacterium]